MKICGDNLEDLRLNKNGDFKDITKKKNNLFYYNTCIICNEPFLAKRKHANYCSKKCLGIAQRGENNPRYGDHRTGDELHGKEKSNELKQNMSSCVSGENNPNYNDKHGSKTNKEGKEYFLSKFKNCLNEEGYVLLSNEGKGNEEYYKVKCPQTHIFETKPKYFYSGKRCPKCYKEKFFSNEQRKQFVLDRGYQILEGNYENNESLLQLKCLCGNKFNITGNKFLSKYIYYNGIGCFNCYTPIHKTPFKDIKKFVEQECGYELLSDEKTYVTNRLIIKCNKGHTFYPSGSNFYRGGTRCPYCAPNCKKTYEEIKSLYESENYQLLTTEDEYINTYQYVDILCDKGHYYRSRVSYFLAGNKCPRCWGESTSSEAEREIQDYSKQLVDNVICNDRTVIINNKTMEGLELDIWFPDLNKAIEYNGDYWHTKDTNTIQKDGMKRNQCKDKGIDLMVIWENEYKQNKNSKLKEVKDFILGE